MIGTKIADREREMERVDDFRSEEKSVSRRGLSDLIGGRRGRENTRADYTWPWSSRDRPVSLQEKRETIGTREFPSTRHPGGGIYK